VTRSAPTVALLLALVSIGCRSTELTDVAARASGSAFRGVNLTVQWGNDPARMSESGGDLVEERGERTIVVKNVSALGRYEAAYGFRSGKTVSLVRFPDAGREYTWDGATVSFAGEDHDTTAAGRYVLGEKGELKTP
jgi:hypothetical protein